jgi:poly(3-hydroxybutyrate) depolymerase
MAGGTVLSHFQAVDKWVTINGCSSTPVLTDLPDIANDGTTIKQRVYSNSTNGSEVVSYVITNGGHTWPLFTSCSGCFTEKIKRFIYPCFILAISSFKS